MQSPRGMNASGLFVIRQNPNKCDNKYAYSFKFVFYIDFSQNVCIIKEKGKYLFCTTEFSQNGGSSPLRAASCRRTNGSMKMYEDEKQQALHRRMPPKRMPPYAATIKNCPFSRGQFFVCRLLVRFEGKKVIRRAIQNLTKLFNGFKLQPGQCVVTELVDGLIGRLHLFNKPVPGFLFAV